jgi:hypothetical protein
MNFKLHEPLLYPIHPKGMLLNPPYLYQGVDASYGGSLFASLLTFCKTYFIQMLQVHCKIINLIKIFMD